MFSTEFEMLCEAFPGVRLPTKRVRTTSESSAVPHSGPGTPRKCDPDVLRSSCQVPNKCQGLGACIDPSSTIKISKGGGGGGSNLDLCDGGMRSRTGSRSIRDFLRLVTSRSSSSSAADDNNDNNNRKSATAQNAGIVADGCHNDDDDGHVVLVSSSRLTQLMREDAMRERSKSDAGSIQRPQKKRRSANDDDDRGKTASDAERGEATGGAGPPPPSPGRRRRGGQNCCSTAVLQTLRVSGISVVSNGDGAKNPIHSPLSPLGRVMSPNHIGPAEFIELYRERAQSDPRPQARMEALANVRRKRVSIYSHPLDN